MKEFVIALFSADVICCFIYLFLDPDRKTKAQKNKKNKSRNPERRRKGCVMLFQTEKQINQNRKDRPRVVFSVFKVKEIKARSWERW